MGRIPRSAEGLWASAECVFKTFDSEYMLTDLRYRVFEFVRDHKQKLDREAREKYSREEEALNNDLDQKLRRHTNRKGECQVEW